MEIELQSGASEIFNPLSYSTLTGSTILFPEFSYVNKAPVGFPW